MLKRLSDRFSKYIDDKTEVINHKDVIVDLTGRTELSGSYLSSIILANLIALLGLLTDSVAVVIGAMLISPLMGPIFSLGLAFTIGDLHLTRKALRNIIFSVVMTVVIAALFTLLSPLKEATQEILARTRPNIFDLLIAVFAGTAGALALCTRKNYLFTTTGVAVATAVIPPLSVVGYGVGTWQFGLAGGGFLLFFTNLVAIVISSNAVFYALRFRGNMAEEPHYTARRRFQILGTSLVIISIPLIITLVTDIRKMKLKGRVENILKTNLNRLQHTRLTKVNISKEEAGYAVSASVNTVKYVDSVVLKKIEYELQEQISGSLKLDLEQVIVRAGAVDPPRILVPAATPPPETLASLKEKNIARVTEGCREVESLMTPYKVAGCSISFSDQQKPIGVTITIGRDYPPKAAELQLLTAVLEKKLTVQVQLRVETIPFLPPLLFTDKNELSDGSRKSMEVIRQIILKYPSYRLTVEMPHSGQRRDQNVKLRTARLKAFLVKDLGVPVDRISVKSVSNEVCRVKVL